MPTLETTVRTFNADVARNGSYLYTTQARLSSQLANRRITDAILALVNLHERRVLDVGCGDGAYTVDLYEQARPSVLYGIEPAGDAVRAAQAKSEGRPIHFREGSAYDLPFADNEFDVVQMRCVLHHLDHPQEALREALRVAPAVVVIEPNGYNPIVKLLERFSRYHIEHEEKSLAPHLLDRWIHQLGAQVAQRSYIGLVPFFCPSAFARFLKGIEPIVEHLPVVRLLSCGQYAFVARR